MSPASTRTSTPGWRSTPTRRTPPPRGPGGDRGDGGRAPGQGGGETGLDYYRDWASRDDQHASFRAHIEIAKRTGKALVIHDRDAHDDVLRVLADQGAPDVVVFHSFSGDAELARKCADAGYFMSFSGPVTYKNAGYLREAAETAPRS
nr:hypothetical protein GCM10020093_063220 [Planobispora longispora]